MQTQLGSPTKMKDIITVENVQRRATIYLPLLKHMAYEERLKKLNLLTLYYGRMRGDMIETYKILTGKYDRTVAQFMLQQQHNSTSLPTQGHVLKLCR